MALPLPLRFALRELRGGLAGLRLLAVCLFLGVAALASVGSLSAAILDSIRAEGRNILGGDIEIRLPFRTATSEELTAFAREGTLTHISRMRAMTGAGEARVLAELKAVDGNYPLYGVAALADGRPLQAALGEGAVLAPELADRLQLRPGGRVTLGRSTLPVAGILTAEPDRAGQGFALGPTIMIARDRLPATGLVQVGSIINQQYRIRLADGADPARSLGRLTQAFPQNDWETRDRSNGAPGLRRFVVQLGQFLTLVGLAALLVAGVGVGQGVASYMAAKTGTIATLKTLGASAGRIQATYLVQIGIVALGSVAAGAAFGALAPWAVLRFAEGLLPVAPSAAIQPGPLLAAMAFGLLTALAFALWPLARAALAPPARLLRSGVEGGGRPARTVALLAAAAGLAVVALAVLRSDNPLFALGFIAGALVLVALLAAFALAVLALLRRLPRPADPLRRLALAGLARPGSAMPQLIVALGLGLTLFATLAVIETSLSAQIRRSLPDAAPDLVVFDVPKEGLGPLKAALAAQAPGASLNAAASLRGPVTAVKGVPVSELAAIPEGAWVLDGDRGLTYSAVPPEGNEVVEGRWWPRDYSGPPLVSMDQEQARLLGLKIGDRITVAVLGAEIEATIANFRRLDFRRPTLQYMFVFNPAAIEGAPHSWVTTISLASPAQEAGLRRAVGRALPTASVVSVRETVAQVNGILEQVLMAVRAAAGVGIAAGIAVLVGAVAASARARTYEAAVMKVLGATRAQVLSVQASEYGLLGLIVGVLALGVGAGAGALILRYALDLPFAPGWGPVLLTIAAGALLTLGVSLAASWRVLGARPAVLLRTE